MRVIQFDLGSDCRVKGGQETNLLIPAWGKYRMGAYQNKLGVGKAKLLIREDTKLCTSLTPAVIRSMNFKSCLLLFEH